MPEIVPRFFYILLLVLYLPLQSHGQTTIAQIEFAASFKLDRSDMLKASGVKVGQAVIPKQIPQFARQLEQGLYEQGYLFARVDSVSVRSGLNQAKSNYISMVKVACPP